MGASKIISIPVLFSLLFLFGISESMADGTNVPGKCVRNCGGSEGGGNTQTPVPNYDPVAEQHKEAEGLNKEGLNYINSRNWRAAADSFRAALKKWPENQEFKINLDKAEDALRNEVVREDLKNKLHRQEQDDVVREDLINTLNKQEQEEVDRMVAILTDSPAIFIVADSNVPANPAPKHYIEYFEQVTKNADRITEAARRHNVDPDLVRAVIWMESTRGYYDSVTGLVLKPKTILPMNVYADYWTGFKVTREGLQNPAINIDTGTKILARIQARTTGSIAKIATLYGDLSAQKVSEYGKTVEYYYNTKPWLKRTNK